jgi:hypothetical protein
MEDIEAGYNSLLSLDKDIVKTSKTTETRHHSVLKLSAFFVKWQANPLLIGAAFSKMANYWHTCNNAIRISLITVAENSCHILKTLTEPDKNLRAFASVLESNDAVARSLTLRYSLNFFIVRLLGIFAEFASNQIQLYHKIIHALQSPKVDLVEFKAAIFIADSFCRYSKAFAHDVCDNIAVSLKGIPKDYLIVRVETSNVDCRFQLVRIYSRMTLDTELAHNAFICCLESLNSIEDDELAALIISTMTSLCIKTCPINRDPLVI